MKHEIIRFQPLQVCYVKYKHDMDSNSNKNYSRKISLASTDHMTCVFETVPWLVQSWQNVVGPQISSITHLHETLVNAFFWPFLFAQTYQQLPLRQWDASNVYLLVLFSWKVNIAENPISVMGLYIRLGCISVFSFQ